MRAGQVLSDFKKQYYLRTVLCHACCYLFLQAFAIPGTGFANLLAGALFGLRLGFTLSIIYTAIGSVILYYFSQIFCSRIIRRFFDRKLQTFQAWARHHKANLFLRLISIRVFPFTPNWFVNMACGQLGVPMHIYIPSSAIGLVPYTFMGCQAGTILTKLHSMQDVMQPQVVGGLVAIGAVGFLLPAIANRLKHARDARKHASADAQAARH
ncbi:hypothetical protein PTSG_04915 [Salpingoeca rosetta]|uniref:VTT domain-containing protein n=1 Tax=Salpingoeca rosetta (strain ATCC 50818 / BSB-021) TaxID=946362 RepID=F2U8Z8_SALR5|nr:uncharacterized protein PTSG_04915 [Salpingoeca rosetta]EGD73201.1 hypothetical protein PTSG_04915 [Salpingoeca rosetta]|eukprot:XP_004994232.1 hypothetical protein PTSG_04915 [Salpingoeca rosetta]